MSFFYGQDIRMSVYQAISDENYYFLEQNKERIKNSTEEKKEDWSIFAIYKGNIQIIDFFYNIVGCLPEKDDDDKYIICQVAYCINEENPDSEKFEETFNYLLTKYDIIPKELYENISKGKYDPIVTNIIDYRDSLLIKGIR